MLFLCVGKVSFTDLQLSHESFEIRQINPIPASAPHPHLSTTLTGQTKSIEQGSHGSMAAGAIPLIAAAPSVVLNFKTKADFNMDQPSASLGFQDSNLLCFQFKTEIEATRRSKYTQT